MQAMIFAAGLGTRLRPLTHETPKPLVEVGGVPMLERVARRLIDEGVKRLVINVHHLGEQVEAFVRARDGFGVETIVVQEPGEAPLETGGGLANAAPHFLRDRPILVHNSDILTDIPLGDLYRVHMEDGDRLATLAVMERETSRHLLFDDVGLLGWANVDTGQERRGPGAAGRGGPIRLQRGARGLPPRPRPLHRDRCVPHLRPLPAHGGSR
jgi:N-acetyl-alpha-D-muramate 1-phosphate uridylyltransferase